MPNCVLSAASCCGPPGRTTSASLRVAREPDVGGHALARARGKPVADPDDEVLAVEPIRAADGQADRLAEIEARRAERLGLAGDVAEREIGVTPLGQRLGLLLAPDRGVDLEGLL